MTHKTRAALAMGLALAWLRASPCAAEDASARVSYGSDHAPRVYSVSVASSYTFRSRLPLRTDGSAARPWGLALGGRFGWQVGGLRGVRAPSFIGFDTNVLFQWAPDARTSYALLYGLFAKHALTRHLRARPYFVYGLGAAQVWVSEVGGRGLGHATRLGFGVDVPVRDKKQLAVALAYHGILMPSFAVAGQPARSTNFHSMVLSVGMWFGP